MEMQSKAENRSSIAKEEEYLLELLCQELSGKEAHGHKEQLDWIRFMQMAERHGVISLLYHSLAEGEHTPGQVKAMSRDISRAIVQQNYRLLFLSKFLVEQLKKADIPVVLLKGVGTAGYYPVPELRKAGDVDLLLLEPEKLEAAGEVLQKCGFKEKERQVALHHIVYETEQGIEIELHTMLVEPFDNQRINRYIKNKQKDCARNVRWTEVMGIQLPVLNTAYHGYELLMHMLQHYLRSGFGLKLLCDWVVFWKEETDPIEQEKYIKLVEESGVKGFSDIITLLCCRYLGLEESKLQWMKLQKYPDVDEMLLEILEAEAFGKSSGERMVALRGNGLLDYIREFHHQMQLNFPKQGKCVLLWPGLWLITLVRFLRNNRSLRKVSSMDVLKMAGKRGKLIKKMNLFTIMKK